ncbi:hypothetical protein Nham_1157 [Nitrobacter hamburgensis X14]|uniref:Uncharacterized protein n=1 Tax=Nitrobacter hamburgensis (strain DSM 10229 / NCIMB 13809 / X14) TaxID=323097 RepID=Q1QP45_NITHX|nr:hypothetical protein [Nitrobacter hamburgensis]ABE62002.1 hypothetical protein Nham_1157 [Nitrobacter hamburgensis X14]
MKVTQTPLTVDRIYRILDARWHYKLPRPRAGYESITSKMAPRSPSGLLQHTSKLPIAPGLSAEIDFVIEAQNQKASMSKTSLDQQIANALVDNAVNDGFLISVNDGEETINRSRNIAEIIKAMFRTNMDTLTLNVEERRVGMITLIYGNGRNGLDVIGDHTDIPHINRLVERTMKEFDR